jgi:hypothetical protein
MDLARSSSLFNAILFLSIGFAVGWINLRRGRRPVDRGDALLRWSETTLPTWKQDPVTAAYTTLHTAAILYIAALFIADVLRHNQPQILSIFAGGGMAYVAFTVGLLLSFPFAAARTQPVPMTICPDGVAHGRLFSPWNVFSHFTSDAGTRTIRLFAARAPELARLSWQPPTTELFQLSTALLDEFLPHSPPVYQIPIYRRWYGLLAVLGAVTIPFILLASITYLLSAAWSWAAYTLSVYLVVLLGVKIIRIYQLG